MKDRRCLISLAYQQISDPALKTTKNSYKNQNIVAFVIANLGFVIARKIFKSNMFIFLEWRSRS